MARRKANATGSIPGTVMMAMTARRTVTDTARKATRRSSGIRDGAAGRRIRS
jgi:hypothetical protein